ncbi:leukotriene A-4 hydrolase-like [Temnothorax curvispinosus]|uniref:Leukotriene A-4 hydrolase-like n=1 Tax=Temnothorax curvispinosus TaxID=300111 RepID=A0A6J1RE56_9HYME|nr:leukotriene A-4 hydrolase-like [Temnothorax curvispinosus]
MDFLSATNRDPHTFSNPGHVTNALDGTLLHRHIDETNSAFGNAIRVDLPSIIGTDNPECKIQIEYETREDSRALYWLTPKQTADGKHPFLLSNNKLINARSWFPCQDTPSVKFTYSATIWAGNLVTCCNYEHLWLNKSFSIFISRKIMRTILYHEDSSPDVTKYVPCERGYFLLCHLGNMLGGPTLFEPFLKSYFNNFAFKSINTADWLNYLYKKFPNNKEMLDGALNGACGSVTLFLHLSYRNCRKSLYGKKNSHSHKLIRNYLT